MMLKFNCLFFHRLNRSAWIMLTPSQLDVFFAGLKHQQYTPGNLHGT